MVEKHAYIALLFFVCCTPMAADAKGPGVKDSPNNLSVAPNAVQMPKQLTDDKSSAYSHLIKAKSLYERNLYREAQLEFEKSLAIKPSPEAYIGLGKVCEQLQGAGAGKSNFEDAVKVDPNLAVAHRELGMFCLENRDLVGADKELSKALVLAPEDQVAANNLVAMWKEQLLKSPTANSHFGLARAYQLSGALDSAQAEYRKGVRLDPNNPILPMARKSFNRALARREAENDLAQSQALEAQGKLSEAYLLVAQAMVYSPENIEFKLDQAELVAKLGQPGMAKLIYINLLKEDPENQTALENLHSLSAPVTEVRTVPGTSIPMPSAVTNPAEVGLPERIQNQTSLSPALNEPISLALDPATRSATRAAISPSPGQTNTGSGITDLCSFLHQMRVKVFNRYAPLSITDPKAA